MPRLLRLLGLLSLALAGQGQQGLPSGWSAHVHNGRTYVPRPASPASLTRQYFNRETGVSSWSAPEQAPERPQPSGSQKPGEGAEAGRGIEEELSRLRTENEDLLRRLAASREAEEEEVDQLTDLQEALQRAHEELATAVSRRRELEEELVTAKELSRVASDFLAVARSNASSIRSDLLLAESRIRSQEAELEEAYQEVAALETELRRMSGDSLRRLRRSSVVDFLTSWYPRRGRTRRASSSPARQTARGAVLQREMHFNETVALLRENITALTLALEGREQLMRELSEEIADLREEAAERYD